MKTPARPRDARKAKRGEAPAADANAVREAPAMAEIALELIDTDPELNPRTVFADEPLEALAESIRDKGVAQPILLRPGLQPGRYRVVAGERRTRAARLAGLTVIPSIIRDLTDDQALEIATIENIQREDLSPLEEANAFRRVVQAKLAADPDLRLKEAKEIIAEAVRKTVRYVEQRMDLLELPKKEQAQVAAGTLSLENARWKVQSIRREKKQLEDRKLDPKDLLIVAELITKADRDPAKMSNWYSATKVTEVDFDLPGDLAFEALRKKRLITFHADRNGDGRSHAGVESYEFTKKDLEHQLPGFGSARRNAVLHGLRIRVLGEPRADQIKAAGGYATWWLNGPFKPDPGKAEEIKKREAAEKAKATKAANAEARLQAALETIDALVRRMAERTPSATDPDFAEALEQLGLPAPWKVDARGNIKAAGGAVVIHDQYYGDTNRAILGQRVLLAAAVNLAAGASFAVEPEPPAGAAQKPEEAAGEPDDDFHPGEVGSDPEDEEDPELTPALRALAGGAGERREIAEPEAADAP